MDSVIIICNYIEKSHVKLSILRVLYLYTLNKYIYIYRYIILFLNMFLSLYFFDSIQIDLSQLER